ncbi:MAG: TIGR02757 family protein [Bacteroidia bacterium]|nr:TIGR02757 family protein [Bacteroidia bacterium]
MQTSELKDFLDAKYLEYNVPEFIQADPVCIPHQFSRREDIEISGFLTSLIAWGRRDIIVRNAQKLMELIEMEPFRFVVEGEEESWENVDQFVHRTFNARDCKSIFRGLRRIYREEGGLEKVLSAGMEGNEEGTKGGILALREIMTQTDGFEPRSSKHLANPEAGSSAKRLNMFLRWMVRKDNRGVDFGLWNSISPSRLIIPLDVHTGTIARKLGLLTRTQNDWKAALELTQILQTFDPNDPVRYDFSLFGLGVNRDLE